MPLIIKLLGAFCFDKVAKTVAVFIEKPNLADALNNSKSLIRGLIAFYGTTKKYDAKELKSIIFNAIR